MGFYNSSHKKVVYHIDSKSFCLAVQTFKAPVPRNLPRFGFRFRVLGFRMFQPKGCYGSRVFRFRVSGFRVQCNLFVRGLPSPDTHRTCLTQILLITWIPKAPPQKSSHPSPLDMNSPCMAEGNVGIKRKEPNPKP